MGSGIEAEAANRAKLLVVDDNAKNVELLDATLTGEGYSVLKAYNGKEALQIIEKERPDLVLLDIRMPEMDGYDVCRAIKANPETASICVIMVTVYDEIEEIERGVEAGADDFLSKPVNRMTVLSRVRIGLRVSKLQDQLDRTLAYLKEIENRKKVKRTQ